MQEMTASGLTLMTHLTATATGIPMILLGRKSTDLFILQAMTASGSMPTIPPFLIRPGIMMKTAEPYGTPHITVMAWEKTVFD